MSPPTLRSSLSAFREDQLAEWTLGDIKTGPQSGKGRKVIFDAEGNGLLRAGNKGPAVTNFWCIAAGDTETGEEFYWGVDLGPDSIEHGLRFLAECEVILAHNGIGYDYPAAEMLYPWWKRPEKSWDTLVICKLIWPTETLIGPDLKRIRMGLMPPQLMKSHSLKAWGLRTGTHKGEYTGGFDEWCPAMAVYLMGDIRGTMELWRWIEKKIATWEKPGFTFWYENEVARIIFEQEQDGVRFDIPKATKLSAELLNEQNRIETRLKETFGSWWQPLCDEQTGRTVAKAFQRKMTEFPDVTVKRYSEKTGKELKPYVGPPLCEFSPDAPFVDIEWTEFNPSSREHLGMRLQDVYGWRPKKFGKGRNGAQGAPTVDESTLEAIPESVMPADIRKLILDYFVVTKTLGMLSKGQKAWLTMAAGPTNANPWHVLGRIHGQMDTTGAVTRRGTHKNPNLSQVPSVAVDKDKHPIMGLEGRYGYECRELLCADEGEEQTGVDASSLELIDLGHYLVQFDNGAFRDRVCDPKRDPHQEHANLAEMSRKDAKRTIYLKIYGGSAYKLSLAIEVLPDEIPALLGYKGLHMLLKNLAVRFDEQFVADLDDAQKAKIAKARQIIVKLESGITGLQDLIKSVQGAAEKGWLKAIDGSRIHVRKPYAALNTLLQSAGAITCKVWMALVHQELKKQNFKWKQILWVHDELQFTHEPGYGLTIARISEECLVKAGELLNLKGRYRSDAKTGLNWAECH